MKKRKSRKHGFKKLSRLFIVIAIIIIIFVIINKRNNVTKETSAETGTQNGSVEWYGNYIWDTSNENNTWMCFRKKVNVEEENLKNIVAQIAVDSKYWLYINGEMVVREGELKRGQTKDSIYYDELDLTNYFHSGENTIAILVWYWGDGSLSHNSSGQGTLLFQAKIGEKYLISDETWKAQKNPAYLQDELRPNNRLSEYNVWYDASLADEDWYKEDYDDTLWGTAHVLNVAGSIPWGEMIERNIPQFKDYGLKEYENIEEYKNYETKTDETLNLKIPYNAQITPYLKIEAPAGLQITIKTDMYEDVSGDSVRCTYITKDGAQEFESLAWMNGENVYYEIPAGVKIISLQYRESGYDTEMTGSFECNDEFFNKLWQMADRTLYVNMRDSYMDCPNRERAQWFGDMNTEMMEAMYALDTNAYDLYEKGVKTTIGWKNENNAWYTVSPLDEENNLHLPTQMLAGISYFYEYYLYTGNKEFLEYVYPYTKEYLNLWQANEKGLMDCTINYPLWEWGDSVAECDYKAIENAWYYFALDGMAEIADVLGYEDDKSNFEVDLENLKNSYNTEFWTENGYKSSDSKTVDERANAIAVISGLADSEKYPIIEKILTNSYESTTYMERFVLEALCQMGNIEEAQERIKYRYDEMVNGNDACSTLWENWDSEIGTKNHAWSGGPLIIMSKYFAGIEPLEKGYDVISIKPQFGNLTKISSNVTTVKGDVTLEAEKLEDTINIKINVPSKTLVAVPKKSEDSEVTVNGEIIYKDGEEKNIKNVKYDSKDEEYIYFYVESGEYEFEVK